MITLEWTRVADHEFERGRSYLVKWGELNDFWSGNTKSACFNNRGDWVMGGEVVGVPDYAFPINSMKHKSTPKALSIGDKVHINHPKTQHWTGTIVAKRNLSRTWIVKDVVGFGTDVSEKYLTKAADK